MSNLYDVLEICLQEIEQGADIDTVLFRYPNFADELRPILEASLDARRMAVPEPSAEVVRRNRAKVLQQAAQMRESQAKPSRRIWFASLRRVAVTLAVVAVLFLSGTNLVRAASATLPGDDLYPVKRTWEDVLLLFTFDVQQREALEIEHENERLHELRELFTEGRAVEVDFAGVVTIQNGNQWVVSGVPVLVSDLTELRDGPIDVGSAVRVKGQTQGDGIVLAERIRLLPPDAKLPSVDMDDDESEEADHGGGAEDNSGKGSGDQTPEAEETEGPRSESELNNESSDEGNGSDSSNSGSGSEDNSGDNSNDDGSHSGSGSDDGSNDDSSDGSGSGGDNSGSGGGGGDD